MLGKGARRVGNRKTNRSDPNYCIVKIEQNTEKSPGDLRKLAVSQTPVNDYQQALKWKTRKEYDNNNNNNNNLVVKLKKDKELNFVFHMPIEVGHFGTILKNPKKGLGELEI